MKINWTKINYEYSKVVHACGEKQDMTFCGVKVKEIYPAKENNTKCTNCMRMIKAYKV